MKRIIKNAEKGARVSPINQKNTVCPNCCPLMNISLWVCRNYVIGNHITMVVAWGGHLGTHNCAPDG